MKVSKRENSIQQSMNGSFTYWTISSNPVDEHSSTSEVNGGWLHPWTCHMYENNTIITVN